MAGAILSLAAHWTIVRGRKNFLMRIKEPRFGFLEVSGVWTWPFHQLVGSRVDKSLGTVPMLTGPGPALSTALSMHYNRTRAAIPYDFINAMVETGQVVEVEDGFWLKFLKRTRTSGIYEQFLKVRSLASSGKLDTRSKGTRPQN